MSYVKDNLLPNEKILFSARIHPVVFLPSVFFLIVTILVFIYSISIKAVDAQSIMLIFSGFLFLYTIFNVLGAFIELLTTEFAVTNRRVIAKTGFIRRHTLEMLLPKVESVSVNQNILGRILNYGTVTVTGTGGTHESFRAIVDPIEVRKKINQIIEGYMRISAQYQQQKASHPTPDNQ